MKKKVTGTNWALLEKLKDSEINCADIPDLTPEFFKNAKLKIPSPKKSLSLRLDSDLVSFFKKQGKGYQTRMNAILRCYMVAAHGK